MRGLSAPLMLLALALAAVCSQAQRDSGSGTGNALSEDVSPNICATGGIPLVKSFDYSVSQERAVLARRVQEYMPTVIKGSRLIDSARHWTAELVASEGAGTWTNSRDEVLPLVMSAVISKNLEFLYQTPGGQRLSNPSNFLFESSTNISLYSLSDMLETLKDDDRAFHFYIQTLMNKYPGEPVHLARDLGPKLQGDMRKFKWDLPATLDPVQFNNKDGVRTGKIQSIMWMGESGAQTPFHFDLTSGLLAQVQGSKCVLLVDNTEENWGKMRLYPWWHPHRRQSMIKHPFDNNEQKFSLDLLPEGLTGVRVAHVAPGDVMYIPGMMWHATSGLRKNTNAYNEFGLAFAFSHENGLGLTDGCSYASMSGRIPFGEKDCKTVKTPINREQYARIKTALECESVVAFGEGSHGYRQYFTEFDMFVKFNHHLTQQQCYKAISDVCQQYIDPVLREGETTEDFLRIFYATRFVELKEDKERVPWSHVDTLGAYLARKDWWKDHKQNNTLNAPKKDAKDHLEVKTDRHLEL